MISLRNFIHYKLTTTRSVLGGHNGSSGSGSCGTQGGGNTDCEPGSDDCKEYTYSDDCDGNNRVIETEDVYEGGC